MRRIPRPNDEHSAAFDACISNLQDLATVQALQAAKPQVIVAGNNFLQRINVGELSLIPASHHINGVDMKAKMTKLYTQKLAKAGQPGRIYYDKWRALAPNGRCPLCGIKQVSTLDHYLSKSDFPVFAIFPFNLIPACRDCNTEKLAHIASCYAEETLHPYFDDVDQSQWLFATLTHTVPVTFNFHVTRTQGWSVDMFQRVEKHMEVFKLNALFSSHAAEELTSRVFWLTKLFQAGGATAVRDHLFDCMESSLHANINSWRTAIYQAMYNDNWFHSNGY